MMSKSFKLIDHSKPATPRAQPLPTNWQLCMFCQKDTNETLQNPSLTIQEDKGAGYRTHAQNLLKFREPGELSMNIQLERIDTGQGIERTLVEHEAKWHTLCRLNSTIRS